MAVSFRIAIALIALLVFALVYGVGEEVVAVIEPLATDSAGTDNGTQLLTWTTRLWSLLPVFATIAVGAYILKQAVVVRG